LVHTGQGGTHFYYRYPETEVRNRAGILGRRIDVRGEGGLVVAPPSVHPDTGRAYEWTRLEDNALDGIPVFDRHWIQPPAQPTIRLGRAHVRERNPDIRDGVSYIQHIEAVSGRGGHNATFRAACKLRESGLPADEALQALSRWNETNANPAWTEKELAHKIHDAYRLA
jgi:hypothetical protein